MNWDHVKEQVVARKLEEVLGAMSLGLLASIPTAESWLVPYAQALTPLATVRIISGLLAVVCAALAWAAYKTPNFKHSQLDGGVWLDRKTGVRYCPNCRGNRKLIPLVDKDDLFWDCPNTDCNKRFRKRLHY